MPSQAVQSGDDRRRFGWLKGIGLLGGVAIAGLCAWQWEFVSTEAVRQTHRVRAAIASATTSNAPSNVGSQTDSEVPEAVITEPVPAVPQNTVPASNPIAESTSPEQLLNHRRYEEADVSALVPLKPGSELQLQPPVQIAVNEMIVKAKAEGVQLGIASGFRSIEDQNHLFFDVKAERGENSRTRAEVSAPPGYSEHHTGYAVDFIDEGLPATHTEESFETTPTYQWLKKNAPAYNFEMSFPKDPNSPVGYEPWHWRYVGNQESLELFYQDQVPAP